MNIAHNISRNDYIMANLTWNGQTMASLAKDNFSSIEDVIKLISTMAGKCFGLAKLSIRNKTQGWSVNMAISTPKSTMMKKIPTNTLPARGTQFAIPF